MNFLQLVERFRLRLRQEGLRKVGERIYRKVHDSLAPPWYKVYWLPVAEVPEPSSGQNIPAGHEAFWRAAVRLTQGVKLQVVHNMSELEAHEAERLKEYFGASALPVVRGHLSKGTELHVLSVKDRVVGHIFFVLGKHQPFQHAILTDRDAMGLDGRIAPALRGRGLLPILLLLSIIHLREQGIERVLADTAEWNVEAIRSMESVGFRYLLKYRLVRGAYRYDRRAS